MAMTEDLSVFFDQDDHAVAAVLDGTAISVIFENQYVEAFDGIATRQPVITAPSASFSAADTTSRLTVAGSTYRVRSVQPDGTGISRVLLELLMPEYQ